MNNRLRNNLTSNHSSLITKIILSCHLLLSFFDLGISIEKLSFSSRFFLFYFGEGNDWVIDTILPPIFFRIKFHAKTILLEEKSYSSEQISVCKLIFTCTVNEKQL